MTRTYPIGSPGREVILRENHPWYFRTKPGEPTLVIPENADYLRWLQKKWYAKAGYPIERDEYSVTPEMFGGEYTAPFIEATDIEVGYDDETIEGLFEPVYDEDLSYDLVSEVEEFIQTVTEIAGLTRRERQVVEWIASGNSLIGDYSARLADALGLGSPITARRHVENALTKLREHWANDMDAQGLVDPRYLEPIRQNEFECMTCHLIYNNTQRTETGECLACTT